MNDGVMAVSVEQYRKALEALEEALEAPKNTLSRDATIQRFEFTVELAWKVSKKIMGSATTAPKQVIREMAQNGYIDDIDFWLRSVDQRNLSSHTYNEVLAEEVYGFASKFAPLARQLLGRLIS